MLITRVLWSRRGEAKFEFFITLSMRVFGAEIVHKPVLHRQKAIFLDAVFCCLRHVYERTRAQISSQKSLNLFWLSFSMHLACAQRNRLHTALLPSSGQTYLEPKDLVGRLGERLVQVKIHAYQKVGSWSRQGQGSQVQCQGRRTCEHS